MNDPNDLGEVDIPDRDPLVVAQETIERQRDWIERAALELQERVCESCMYQRGNLCDTTSCGVCDLLRPGWPWEYGPKKGKSDATTEEDPPVDS